MTNKIGWCDTTINPITGCLNNCPYCYARKFATRHAGRFGYPADNPFRPTFHPDKLDDIQALKGKGKRVFLGSMGDFFSEGMNPQWLHQTIDAVRGKPEHHFLILTKRPDRMQFYLHCQAIPENLWFGVSITRQEDVHRLDELHGGLPRTCHRFVSFEPLHGPIEADLSGIEWAIIGGESGNRIGKITPKMEWIESIFASKPDNLPVWMKGNLGPDLMQSGGFIQQVPEAMTCQ